MDLRGLPYGPNRLITTMMPVLKLGGLFALAFLVAATAAAQKKNPYRNYTEEKFVENMQAAGRNYAAVTTLIGGSA